MGPIACVAVAGALACTLALAALDYSLGPEIPNSQYDDRTMQLTGEDTLEYMDNLKENVDASITPLSDMKSMSSLDEDFYESETIDMNYIYDNNVQDNIVTPCYIDLGYVDVDKYSPENNWEDTVERTTQFDPHEYIKSRTRPTEYFRLISTLKKRKSKPRGRVGRPRKATLFPNAKLQVENVTRASRKRMKWNHNMNKFIMYTYYYVTKLETDRNQYRRKMREKFLEAYPDWTDITEQRLADQKRSITQNRLIDIETTREIKRTVRQELEKKGIVIEDTAIDSRDRSFYD